MIRDERLGTMAETVNADDRGAIGADDRQGGR